MEYQVVVGLETHVELAPKSKVFSPTKAEFGGEPNTYVSPICLGMPGTLPTLNRVAFEMALKVGMAMNCTIPEVTIFDRKHYYYPDLPKNYQISQEYMPLATDGKLRIYLADGREKDIRIHNIHLEEDAGKLMHQLYKGRYVSLVDLNRAGTSLLEIVSQPDMESREEAETFMKTMRTLLRYLEVSDCKMQEGSLRFELNISLRFPGTEEFGTKVEVKNIGSIKAVLRAFDYEYKRQADILDEGGRVVQETRLWDDEKGETRSMRVKETAKDYRYFPEPDIPPMVLKEDYLQKIRESIPELREEKHKRFIAEFGLPDYDAGVLVADKAVANYFEECVNRHNSPKAFSNWIMVYILRDLKDEDSDIRDHPVTTDHLVELVQMVEKGTINQNIAKNIFKDIVETGKMPSEIVKEKGLEVVSDESAIEGMVDEVIAENPGPAEEFKNGKDQTLNFLLGMVMKKSKGKANPGTVRELITKKLRG